MSDFPIVTGADVARGLDVVARMFANGDLDARAFPRVGLNVGVGLTTAAAVKEFAARVGVPTTSGAPNYISATTSVHGVNLHVYFIADEEAAR